MWILFFWLRIGTDSELCEHDNEPLGSIKCGEFLDQLSVLLASQERLCMELVS
jgi:hypothetical protein